MLVLVWIGKSLIVLVVLWIVYVTIRDRSREGYQRKDAIFPNTEIIPYPNDSPIGRIACYVAEAAIRHGADAVLLDVSYNPRGIAVSFYRDNDKLAQTMLEGLEKLEDAMPLPLCWAQPILLQFYLMSALSRRRKENTRDELRDDREQFLTTHDPHLLKIIVQFDFRCYLPKLVADKPKDSNVLTGDKPDA